MNQQLHQAMNRTQANLQVLYVKLHNYHWNVKGGQFFAIHHLTEEYYNSLTEQYDAIAERLLQLGEKPLVTMKDYLSVANIAESTEQSFTPEQVIENLIEDFSSLLKDYKEIAELAETVNDSTTANIAEANLEWLEKALWMLKASK